MQLAMGCTSWDVHPMGHAMGLARLPMRRSMRRHIDYKIPLEVHKPIRGIITPVGCPMGQPTGRPMGCLMGTNMSGIWGVLRDVTQESQKCTSIMGRPAGRHTGISKVYIHPWSGSANHDILCLGGGNY